MNTYLIAVDSALMDECLPSRPGAVGVREPAKGGACERSESEARLTEGFLLNERAEAKTHVQRERIMGPLCDVGRSAVFSGCDARECARRCKLEEIPSAPRRVVRLLANSPRNPAPKHDPVFRMMFRD